MTLKKRSDFSDINEAVRSVAVELGSTKVILFGSFARGTETERSDVDLVVIQETKERFVERPAEFMKRLYDRLRGRGVDVLVYTPEEYQRLQLIGNRFLARVLREGKILYES